MEKTYLKKCWSLFPKLGPQTTDPRRLKTQNRKTKQKLRHNIQTAENEDTKILKLGKEKRLIL